MKWIRLVYASGVASAAATGFCSPLWYLGFAPLSAGLIWAAYDLMEVPSDEPSAAPQY